MKPTKGLLQGMPYTPAAKTNLHKTFARIRRELKAKQQETERSHLRIVQRVKA